MKPPVRNIFRWSWLLILLVGLVLGGAIVGVFAAQPHSTAGVPTSIPAPTSASANQPTSALPTASTSAPASATATLVPVDVTRSRPYSDTSPWNTPIVAAPKYDPHSDKMIATLGLDDGQISADTGHYSYTIYYVDASTPRWDIPCTRYKCSIYAQGQIRKTDMLTGVPLPPDAKPSSGTDMQMIVIDKQTYDEYNLWGVERTADGWTMRNGSIYNTRLDAIPTNFGSRGAGVPYLAGLVRQWEIDQGHIDHAISFSYSYPAENRCTFPASKTDGNSQLPYAIPEGARLQLDPTLTEADFDHMGLNRTGKIIARALQQYGMILVNYGGHTKINVENLADNPFATAQWSDPQYDMTGKTIADIPYTAFHVLALPDAYWNPTSDALTHGKCYDYPPGTLPGQ
jgi:hypothetical protein